MMNNPFSWKRAILLLLSPILILGSVQSQNIHKLSLQEFRNATELFNKGLYTAADAEFATILKSQGSMSVFDLSEIEAYRTMCAIELKRADLEGIVDEFKEKYPWSLHLNRINLKLASWYFDNSDFVKAYQILSEVNGKSLSGQEITDFYFKSGYCNLRVGKIDKALTDFAEIIYRPAGQYTSASQYYTAYIHYIKKDFKQAIEKFKSLVTDKRFSTLSRYYILESNFMLENHKYVVDNGEQLYNTMEREYKAKTARMMSESYFALNKPDEAKFYFDKYTLYSGELSRKDIYYSGMIAYTLRNYILANESLQKLLNVDDSLAQNARYHMANSYLQLKNKQKALESFKTASESSFDQAIKEDAFFNYAKLAFDLYSDISLFDRYAKEYTPSETKSVEIKTYMATSFIAKQDYKSATEILAQIKNPGDVQNKLLQRASFLRGLQLIDLGAYRESAQYLEKSSELAKYNDYLAALSLFWLAESKYRDSKYSEAVQINEVLLNRTGKFRSSNEYKLLSFNLGYALLRMGDYAKAQTNFTNFLGFVRQGSELYSEASMRLADCLFMQKKYAEASNAYSQVTSENMDIYLYSLLQKAISVGLTGNDAQKITILRDAVQKHPDATYYPELQYELGRTLVQTGDNTGASACFADIIESHKSSPFYVKSLLEMGLISLNKKEINTSIEYYKRIISEFPSSAEAQDALAGLENVYQESDRTDEFLAFLDKSGLSSAKSTSEKETLIYNTGERQFLNGNYAASISSLKKYLNDYPHGSKVSNAYFYIGEASNKLGKSEEALDAFRKVIELGDASFTELATLHFARISYNLQNYKQSFGAFQSLENIAKIDNNITEARVGMLNSLFMDKLYKEAIAEAGKLNQNLLNDERKARVKFILAKSKFMTGERAQAITSLKEISKNYASEEGAESYYLLIQNAFESGNFKEVENLVFAFSDTRTPQKYWLARSYILLGDSYAERENWEQARATYKSILESYKPSGTGDDISDMINTKMNNIKNK